MSDVETDRRNVVRIHYVIIGSTDYYAADQDEADEMTRIYPGLRDMVSEELLVQGGLAGDRPVRRLWRRDAQWAEY